MANQVDKILTDIAKKHFHNVETLEDRKNDDLNFHELAVWSIKAALLDAFKAGRESVSKDK